jgi:hypothetical protein
MVSFFLQQIADETRLSREEVVRIFDEVAGSFLSEVFGYDVDFFLEKGVFYIYKDSGIVCEPLSSLSKSIIKGIIARVKREVRRRCEEEYLFRIYRVVRRRIKTLVQGRVVGKKGRDYYVEFFLENDAVLPGRENLIHLVGVCSFADTTISDRKSLKIGDTKFFLLKNCYLERFNNLLRLVVILSRMSKTFVKKLFSHFGVDEKDILDVKRGFYRAKGKRRVFKTVVYAKNKLPKEVIRQVAKEIDEEVIVKYGKVTLQAIESKKVHKGGML